MVEQLSSVYYDVYYDAHFFSSVNDYIRFGCLVNHTRRQVEISAYLFSETLPNANECFYAPTIWDFDEAIEEAQDLIEDFCDWSNENEIILSDDFRKNAFPELVAKAITDDPSRLTMSIGLMDSEQLAEEEQEIGVNLRNELPAIAANCNDLEVDVNAYDRQISAQKIRVEEYLRDLEAMSGDEAFSICSNAVNREIRALDELIKAKKRKDNLDRQIRVLHEMDEINKRYENE